jgi:hypothetical protein
VAIGKPEKCRTFGDLADTFINVVLRKGSQYSTVDVLFDRYRDQIIKAATRTHHSRRTQTI